MPRSAFCGSYPGELSRFGRGSVRLSRLGGGKVGLGSNRMIFLFLWTFSCKALSFLAVKELGEIVRSGLGPDFVLA